LPEKKEVPVVDLLIDPSGQVRCLYSEAIALSHLGDCSICRASLVEPTCEGMRLADLAPVKGPVLGPFDCRSDALAAEGQWLWQIQEAWE
jgi:hypothetical protein